MSDPNAAFQPPPPPPPALPATEPPKPKAKYLLIPGLVIIVIGIAILGAGFAKVLTGGVGTGAIIAIFGIILIALSFVNLPAHDPEAPLSDGRIAELLSGEGIPVARRTVAKYREAMGIAASNERRRTGPKQM